MTDEQITALVQNAKTETLERIEQSRLETLERIEHTRIEMLERSEKIETTLLKEFRKWAVRIEGRGKVADASLSGFNERLLVLEERVDDIEAGQ